MVFRIYCMCLMIFASSISVSADCVQCDFKGQNLAFADFSNQDLSGAIFSGAYLINANFEGAKLTDANFSGSRANGASFRDTRLRNVKFIGAELELADFTDAYLTNVDFTNAFVRHVKMTKEQSQQSNFCQTTLRDAVLRGVTCKELVCINGKIADAVSKVSRRATRLVKL